MPNNPIRAADRLADSLDENTHALNSLKRRYRLVVGTLALTILLVISMIVTRYDQRLSGCERDNDLRQANVDLWTPVLQGSPPPVDPGPDATEEEREKYERNVRLRADFEKTLNTGFALRDCDGISWL